MSSYRCVLLLAVALMFAVVPLEGAAVVRSLVHSPGADSNNLHNVSSKDNTTRNSTVSDEKNDIMSKFLQRSRVESAEQDESRSLNNTVDGSSHSRVRRWTEMSIEMIQTSSENLQARSKCAWTYTYNTDPSRQPRTLVEAQCSQMYVPGLAGQCEHVYYYVPVKQNVAGDWVDRWIWLRVGCTLAEPLGAPPITFD